MKVKTKHFWKQRFTLLEMLVAVGIAVSVLALVFALVSTAVKNWERHRNRNDVWRQGHLAIQTLSRDLRTVPGALHRRPEQALFSLSDGVLRFYALSPGGRSDAGLPFADNRYAELEYRLAPAAGETGQPALSRHTYDRNGEPVKPRRFEAVTTFAVEAMSETGEWVDSWDRAGLPAAVRVNISSSGVDENYTVTFERVVPLPCGVRGSLTQ